MWVHSADFQCHQLISHYLKSHMMGELVCVATQRQLPPVHPLHQVQQLTSVLHLFTCRILDPVCSCVSRALGSITIKLQTQTTHLFPSSVPPRLDQPGFPCQLRDWISSSCPSWGLVSCEPTCDLCGDSCPGSVGWLTLSCSVLLSGLCFFQDISINFPVVLFVPTCSSFPYFLHLHVFSYTRSVQVCCCTLSCPSLHLPVCLCLRPVLNVKNHLLCFGPPAVVF